ncbi:MAG: metallophosphoesterase family protein [Planctomycetes bacterium]|nr:metallophosphoesterase family protein [Planctomycetota bacterium]
MKRAILSDIHGNLEALQAVLADIRSNDVDEVVCLGDIVGYGPNPAECIDIASSFRFTVLGNHDQGALFDPEGFSSGAERAIFWTRKQLESGDPDVESTRRRLRFLCELPRSFRDNGTLFVHGSARNPLNEYVFPEDIYNARKIEKIFGLIASCCFQGHTHVPGVFTQDGRFFSPTELGHQFVLGNQKAMVNVGSVGQPRDGDYRSSYVILDGPRVHFRRVDYPVEVTVRKIHAISELDNFLGDRLREGR